MSVDNSRLKLLKGIIDIDGSQKPDVINSVLGHNFTSVHLYEYNAKAKKFIDTAESLIYDFAVEYFEKYNVLVTIDILLESISQSGMSAQQKDEILNVVNNLGNVEFQPSELGYVLGELNTEYAKHKLFYLSQSGLERLETTGDIADTVSFLFKGLTQVSELANKTVKVHDTAMVIQDFAEEMHNQWLENKSFSKPCAEYGFLPMDQGVGGLKAGEVVAIGGLPGVGKSFIAQSIAQTNAFLKERNVIYATTENTPQQIWTRMVSSMTGIPLKKLDNNALNAEELETYMAFAEQLRTSSASNFWIVPRSKAENTYVLQNTIESLIGDKELHLLVIDHVNNMSYKGITERWVTVEKALDGCKGLATKFNCSVVTPTHLNRKGNSADAGMDAVQYQSVNQLADHLWMVTEDPDNPSIPPEYDEWRGKPGRLIVKNVKGRSAAKNQVFYLSADLSVASVTAYQEFKKPAYKTKEKKGKSEKESDEKDV